MATLKKIISIFFIIIIKLFTRTKVSLSAQIPPNVFFQLIRNPSLKANLGKGIIGRGVNFSEGVKIFFNPQIIGDVEIGRNTSINGPSTRISAKINKIKIGSFCSIASNVVIQEYYHNTSKATTYNIFSNLFDEKINDEVISKGEIIIGDDVWIGSNAVVLSGIKIGRGAVIGAGAIVTKDVPSYAIVAGNPAQVIKFRFSEETILQLEQSKWWSWSDKKIIYEKDFFNKIRY